MIAIRIIEYEVDNEKKLNVARFLSIILTVIGYLSVDRWNRRYERGLSMLPSAARSRRRQSMAPQAGISSITSNRGGNHRILGGYG